MYKEIIKPALILFVICAVVAGALAFVHDTAGPIIEMRAAQDKLASLKRVLPGATAFGEQEPAEALAARGLDVPGTVRGVYAGSDGGQPAGYVIEVAPKGYSGSISMLVGVAPGGALAGVVVLHHGETPGLGSKAADAAYLRQYEGLPVSLELAVVKTARKAEGDIEAVSGATISSRAVARGVQDAMDMAELLAKEVG